MKRAPSTRLSTQASPQQGRSAQGLQLDARARHLPPQPASGPRPRAPPTPSPGGTPRRGQARSHPSTERLDLSLSSAEHHARPGLQMTSQTHQRRMAQTKRPRHSTQRRRLRRPNTPRLKPLQMRRRETSSRSPRTHRQLTALPATPNSRPKLHSTHSPSVPSRGHSTTRNKKARRESGPPVRVFLGCAGKWEAAAGSHTGSLQYSHWVRSNHGLTQCENAIRGDCTFGSFVFSIVAFMVLGIGSIACGLLGPDTSCME